MKIDPETLGFMRKHGIADSHVYDARSKHSRDWKLEMQKAGKRFAYVDRPGCRKGGHLLYNKGQACVVCRPIFIGMTKHYHSTGTVYVAVSAKATNLVKIGSTTTDRAKTLNRHSYGGLDDWRIVHEERVEEVGKIEALAHAELKHYRVRGLIYRGDEREAGEIFECSEATAKEAVKRAAASN